MNATQPHNRTGEGTAALRAMTPDDLPAAIDLWSRAAGVSIAEGDSLEELARYLQRNPGASQVVCEGGRLIGAVLAGHDGRRGFLYHLAVDSERQGRGYGRLLAERALAVLREAGLRRVLILVARDNAAGRAFWARCGWEGMEFAEPMGIDL